MKTALSSTTPCAHVNSISKSTKTRWAKAALAAAVCSAIGGSASALAGDVYWDVNGTAAGSGVSTFTPAWNGGAVPASPALWDAGATSNWNTDSAGGAGTFSNDITANNIGNFSAGTDAGTSYFIEIPDGVHVTAGGLTVNQGGEVVIAGYGNGGKGGPHGSTANWVNIGSGTFNINVPTGSRLDFGYTLALPSFAGSGTISVSGGGMFVNTADEVNSFSFPETTGNYTFTGKYDVEGPGTTMGLFYGGNSMLPDEGTTVADELKVGNNATIETFTNSTSAKIVGHVGVTIGSGGATFYFAGYKGLDPTFGFTNIAAVNFGSVITGGTASSRVPITIKSNVWNTTSTAIGDSQGGTAALQIDNSSSLFAKWILHGGEVYIQGGDNSLGQVPTSYLADAITLDKDSSFADPTVGGANIMWRGTAATLTNTTIPANRGITLGAGGGGIHPYNATNANGAGPASITVNSIITGAGQLRVFLEQNAGAKVILAGANNYTGGTWITGTADSAPLGTLQGTTTSLQGNIQNDTGGTLDFDQTTTGSYAGTISGGGALVKTNTGIVDFTGTNTYTGTTTISGGALVADSAASLPGYNVSNKVTVNSGAALAVTSTNWSSGNISAVESSATFNSGSYFGFNVPTANTYTYATTSHPANAGIFKTGGGDLTISGSSTGNGSLWINAGKVIMSSSGATLGNAPGPITIDSGTLDITNNRLITSNAVGTFNAGSYTAGSITRWIHDAVVTSSTAVSQGGLTGVAVSTGANVKGLSGTQTATWAGYTVHATDTLIMYTYAGDDTLDGTINGDDYARIDSGFAGHLTGYDNGDFNLDGKINADDYFIIDSNYGRQTLGFTAPAPPLAGVSAVPEPGSLALLAAATGGLLLRRRRRRLRALSY